MRVKRVHLGCSKESMAAEGAALTRNKEQHHLNRDEKENKNRGPHSGEAALSLGIHQQRGRQQYERYEGEKRDTGKSLIEKDEAGER